MFYASYTVGLHVELWPFLSCCCILNRVYSLQERRHVSVVKSERNTCFAISSSFFNLVSDK